MTMHATVARVGMHIVVCSFLAAPSLFGSTSATSASLDLMRTRSGAHQESETAQTPAEEFDQAMQTAAAALQNGDFESALRAATAYERAHELRPESIQTCLALGRTYRRLSLHEETIALIDECLAAAGPAPNLELMRGRTLLQMGMGSEARAAFEAATTAGAVEARSDLGLLAWAQGDLDVAVEELEALIRVRPRRALVYVRLAEVYIDRLEVATAEGLLQRVLEMEACCAAQAHNLLGLIRYKAGDLEGAVTHGREAIRLDEDLGLAHYNLAMALRDSGQREQSQQVIQRFQEIDSAANQRELEENRATQIAMLNAQGLYYFRRDDPAEALKLFEAALGFAPDDALIHFNIGLSRSSLGQHEGATTALERARELQPKRAETYVLLAAAYRALGRAADAQRIDELHQQLEGQH